MSNFEGWDSYFYNVCLAISENTKCFSRKIGAVLVRDKSIVSTGYNGPPRGVPPCDQRWFEDLNLLKEWQEYKGGALKEIVDSETATEQFKGIVKGQCPRKVLGMKSGERIDLCPAAHAEENTILDAARRGVCTKDTTMYMTCGIPCSKCLVKIINAGVKDLVVTSFEVYDVTTEYLLNNSNLGIRLFDFIEKKVNKP